MHLHVVGAEHLQGEDRLELAQGQRRRGVRVGVAALPDGGEGRAREGVDAAHQRAHEALDVPAVAWGPHGPVVDADAVLPAATPEGLRVELAGVVHVGAPRQARDRPRQGEAARRQPFVLRQHGVRERERERHAGRRGRVERDQKARHGTGVHVEGERQPGAADRPPGGVVHDHQVDERVVDLQHVQRAFGRQVARGGSEALPGRARTRRRTALALGALRSTRRHSCRTASTRAAPVGFCRLR